MLAQNSKKIKPSLNELFDMKGIFKAIENQPKQIESFV
jgi:hypothetical protein